MIKNRNDKVNIDSFIKVFMQADKLLKEKIHFKGDEL